jgi:hypothetical protein
MEKIIILCTDTYVVHKVQVITLALRHSIRTLELSTLFIVYCNDY